MSVVVGGCTLGRALIIYIFIVISMRRWLVMTPSMDTNFRPEENKGRNDEV